MDVDLSVVLFHNYAGAARNPYVAGEIEIGVIAEGPEPRKNLVLLKFRTHHHFVATHLRRNAHVLEFRPRPILVLVPDEILGGLPDGDFRAGLIPSFDHQFAG